MGDCWYRRYRTQRLRSQVDLAPLLHSHRQSSRISPPVVCLMRRQSKGSAALYIERMRQNKLVVVQSYGTGVEAQVARGVLESSGIEAMIQADTAGRMREHLAWSGLGHRLLVREEDAATARSILCSP